MHNFTEYEKSGAVWMFSLPGWGEEEYRCFSKAVFTRDEALDEFAWCYDVTPGEEIVELRAEDQSIKRVTLKYEQEYYTIVDIVVDETECRISVASDKVNLNEDPRRADGLWCVDRSAADKFAVGDYIKKPENVLRLV